MRAWAQGFPPVSDSSSKLLILGSFPSVKSRETAFYYGNPQNRFWRTVCGYFSCMVPPDREGKIAFLLGHGIALWDMVVRCEITGSADASIASPEVADIPALLEQTKVQAIFCNGKLAYDLLLSHYPGLGSAARRLPSTSPANPAFSAQVWQDALAEIFPR